MDRDEYHEMMADLQDLQRPSEVVERAIDTARTQAAPIYYQAVSYAPPFHVQRQESAPGAFLLYFALYFFVGIMLVPVIAVFLMG